MLYGEGIEIWSDVRSFPRRSVDVVAGGWPCQDLTVAGRMLGLAGHRSSLFFEMVRVAKDCRANTVVGENVPNLLSNRKGRDFQLVLGALHGAGFRHVAWRVLDSRDFGLPQARRRLFLVASKHESVAMSLHRPVTGESRAKLRAPRARSGNTYGFYWTGGESRSLCLSRGHTPALKVGSSTSKGTSPVGVFVDGIVRKLAPVECLRLQGFWDARPFEGHILGDVYRMAGNAVARPVGHFVMGGLSLKHYEAGELRACVDVPEAGVSNDHVVREVVSESSVAKYDLGMYLDFDLEPLSPQASAGLLTRVIRGRRWIPPEMFDALYARSRRRTSLIGTRVNSFEILDNEMKPLRFREWLTAQRVHA